MAGRPAGRDDLAVIVTLLVAMTVANGRLLDGRVVALAQLAFAAVAVLWARRRRYTWAELGLARSTLSAGLRLGAVTGAMAVTGVAIVAIVPTTRGFFDDDRFLGLSVGETIYEIAVRIPVVTALTEELLFRSVLLAVLLVNCSAKRAVAVSSLLFGLWHVLTALDDLGENEATKSFAGWDVVLAVAGIVAATGAAGVVFAWLRLRSNSVVAPWLVHAVLNASTFGVGVALAT